MKLIATLALFTSIACHAEEASHLGAGIGSNYGGIGVKYSQEINSAIDLYANVGQCVGFAILSYTNGVSGSLGAEIAVSENQHHTFNAALAILDAKDYSSDYSSYRNKNRLTGHAFGYTYYFSGMRSTGQAVGVSAIKLSDYDESLSSISISWGYRF